MEKYSLITGASRGIGRAVALALAGQGRNLILVADQDRLGLFHTLSLVRHTYIENFGMGPAMYMCCRTFLCDVSDADMVDNLFEKLEKDGCRVEILVNNAGVSHFDLVQDTSTASWRKVLGTNLDGPFYMCRKVVPGMVRDKAGSIINISSYWGIAGSAMESAYCASKGGLNSFTLSLAKELEPSGIRVNALACEFVNTEMNAFLNEEEVAGALELMPSKRVIEPEEIADMVLELIRPEDTRTAQIIAMKENTDS